MTCDCDKLKREIEMLSKMVALARPEEWDAEFFYKDIINGTDNGNKCDGIDPDPEFAAWFAKKFDLDVEKIK